MRVIWMGLLVWLGLFVPAARLYAQAQAPEQALIESTQRWLNEEITKLKPSADQPLRMQVTLGALDSRLQLAPCAKMEPYIPVGTRLWGKTRLGIRCTQGAVKWNVFLPVTVKAFGNAWVIKGNVASGAVLTAGDALLSEVDWAEEASPVVFDAAQWVGQVATRQLSTGQVVRQSVLKPAQVFQAGAQIRVVAQGPGFQVVSDGQALSAGVIGQLARVRMDNGRILSGVVMDARTVKVEL